MGELCHVEKEHFGICLLLPDHSSNQVDFFLNACMKLWGNHGPRLFQTVMELLRIASGDAKWNANTIATWVNSMVASSKVM